MTSPSAPSNMSTSTNTNTMDSTTNENKTPPPTAAAAAAAHHSSRYELIPVQSTSLLVAYWRDLETRRQSPAPLIQDEPARTLLDAFLHAEQRQEYETSPIRSYGLDMVALRTRAMDEWLFTKNKNGGENRQMVNLGAGMCCRPYRLEGLKEVKTKVWEIDSDLDLLTKKRAVLKEAGYQTHLPVEDASADLGSEESHLAEVLHKTGFQSDAQGTDWLAEGLFAYLSPAQHDKLLRETADLSATHSRMVATIAEPALFHFWDSLGKSSNIPWRELVPVQTILDRAASYGWVVDRHIGPDDWPNLYPGRGQKIPGYRLVFFEKVEK